MIAETEPMTSAAYHAHKAIGSSMLRDFIKSPRIFEARYVCDPATMEFESSDAMDFGTVCHTAVLADSPLKDVVVEIPAEVLTSDGKKAGGKWKEFLANNDGKILLKRGDYDRVLKVRDSVFAHPRARMILEAPGAVEESLFWECRQTGLSRKARIDKLADIGGTVLGDFKTTDDPDDEAWAKSAYKFGYHIQKAFYRDAVEADDVRPPMVFIVAGKKAPFITRVYDLDEQATQLGEFICHSALEDLEDRLRRKDWREKNEDKVTELAFPQWVYRR